MKRLLCIALVFVGLSGVASIPAQGVIGMASWYGREHHGKKTSKGRRFNEHALTAASPTLPFGTRVRVTYLKTGKSVIVHITDRGPFKRHRILDLSEGAANVIGLKQHGVGRIKVEDIQ